MACTLSTSSSLQFTRAAFKNSKKSSRVAVQVRAGQAAPQKNPSSSERESKLPFEEQDDPNMYKNMVPLSERKGKGKPLRVFEVKDTETQRTLDSLFMGSQDDEDDGPHHAACMRDNSGAVICGADEDLLYAAAPACVASGGVFIATTSTMKYPEPTFDIGEP